MSSLVDDLCEFLVKSCDYKNLDIALGDVVMPVETLSTPNGVLPYIYHYMQKVDAILGEDAGWTTGMEIVRDRDGLFGAAVKEIGEDIGFLEARYPVFSLALDAIYTAKELSPAQTLSENNRVVVDLLPLLDFEPGMEVYNGVSVQSWTEDADSDKQTAWGRTVPRD